MASWLACIKLQNFGQIQSAECVRLEYRDFSMMMIILADHLISRLIFAQVQRSGGRVQFWANFD